MSDATDAPTKPRRKRRWRWLLWLAATLLIAGFGINYLLKPEKLGALLLRQINERSGLVVTTTEPARVGWWPQLHIELSGLDARLPGNDAALLQAESLDLSLPLSLLTDSLLGREPEPRITGLTLRSPRLDLDAFMTWMGPASSEYELPDIDSPLAIESGQLLGNGWQIDGFNLELDQLHAGQPSHLQGSLRYVPLPEGSTPPLPLTFDITATPTIDTGALRLDPLQAELQSDQDPISTSGSLLLSPSGALRTGLVIQLPQWPQRLPALPLPPDNKRFTLKLDFDERTDGQGQLDLDIQSDIDRIAGKLQIGEWLGWLGASSKDTWMLPPVTGSLTASRLQQGDILLDDATIDFDDGSTPATNAASSNP